MRDYLALITSEHRDKPKFTGVVDLLTKPLADANAVVSSLPAKFNLDEAVGVQLDAVGLWVGLPRKFTVPISGAFFSFNITGLGWNEGYWKGADAPGGGINTLDDETYRMIIRARIARNYWDGTFQQQIDILAADLLAMGITLVPVDNFDMSLTVQVLGQPTTVIMELLQRGYIVPKPMGVHLYTVLGSVGGGSIFALDSATAGLDSGAFV